MRDLKVVTVEIQGQQYPIKTSLDAAYVHRLAAHVESRLQKAAQAAMEHRVLSEAPEELRYLVHEVIRLARVYTALDDLEHYQTTRLTLPLRRGLRAIGGRLVQAGVLADPSDVYFVPLRILDAAMRDERLDAIPAAVAEHKRGYEAATQRVPDWVHGEQAADDVIGELLKGLGGSPGVVEGAVFVVKGPEDFARFPKDAKAADAHYWLGEALLGQQKYRDAAETFLAASKQYPKAKKAPDMLLKLGVSLVGLKQKDVACATFNEVGKRYPDISSALKERVKQEKALAAC